MLRDAAVGSVRLTCRRVETINCMESLRERRGSAGQCSLSFFFFFRCWQCVTRARGDCVRTDVDRRHPPPSTVRHPPCALAWAP